MAGSSKKVIIAALIGNSLVAIAKFFAAATCASRKLLIFVILDYSVSRFKCVSVSHCYHQ
jgi:hypothetical protein